MTVQIQELHPIPSNYLTLLNFHDIWDGYSMPQYHALYLSKYPADAHLVSVNYSQCTPNIGWVGLGWASALGEICHGFKSCLSFGLIIIGWDSSHWSDTRIIWLGGASCRLSVTPWILQGNSIIKVSIEYPALNRQRRNLNERSLKGNKNKHIQACDYAVQ